MSESRETALCVSVVFHVLLPVTPFTLRSGGATWGPLAAEVTACWLDTAVRRVWRETVEWHHIKHLLAQSHVLMTAVRTIRSPKECWYILVFNVQISDDLHLCSLTVFLLYTIPLKHNLHYASFPHSPWPVTNSCFSITLHLHVHALCAWTNSCTEHWHLMDRLKWMFWPEFHIMRQFLTCGGGRFDNASGSTAR